MFWIRFKSFAFHTASFTRTTICIGKNCITFTTLIILIAAEFVFRPFIAFTTLLTWLAFTTCVAFEQWIVFCSKFTKCFNTSALYTAFFRAITEAIWIFFIFDIVLIWTAKFVRVTRAVFIVGIWLSWNAVGNVNYDSSTSVFGFLFWFCAKLWIWTRILARATVFCWVTRAVLRICQVVVTFAALYSWEIIFTLTDAWFCDWIVMFRS